MLQSQISKGTYDLCSNTHVFMIACTAILKKKCINDKPACIYDQFNHEPAAAFGPSSSSCEEGSRGASTPHRRWWVCQLRIQRINLDITARG